MRRLPLVLAVALSLALAACATPKKAESEAPKAALPPAAEVPIHDKFVIPGSDLRKICKVP